MKTQDVAVPEDEIRLDMAKMPTIRVYLAGPLSVGNVTDNIRNAIDVANHLRSYGLYPFVPHLTHLWNLITPRVYEDWMDYDSAWLTTCHAVYRMSGKSPGADREVKLARQLGIKVFDELEELITWAISGAE